MPGRGGHGGRRKAAGLPAVVSCPHLWPNAEQPLQASLRPRSSQWHSGAQLRTPHPLSMSRRIAVVAEEQGHHPDLHLTGYNNVAAEMTTHAARGLTENDFIMAAKVGDGAGRQAQRIHLPQPA